MTGAELTPAFRFRTATITIVDRARRSESHIESNDGANVFHGGLSWTEQDQLTAQFYRVA